ncbi:hypothetical protein [Alkalihalobacterium elongatum]|uniref:hypothetical protein n=1 Tax=Alkalihalobacterium elongatum TaxID=2675466 RepID=UPI001C1FF789|nr:hypothetical protein [Alkalihalobacterium elongatum]
MKKQRLILVLATLSFGVVWSVVIMQIISAQERVLTGRIISNLERTTIEKQNVENILWIKDWDTHVVKNAQITNQLKEIEKRDLRAISFRDIDTTDGVPIDIILKRLDLE